MPFSAKFIRRLRRFLIGLACFATLLAVVWQIENIRGQRAWKAAFKTYADRGDPLDALPQPTPIPAGKNFWQTPMLARLAWASGLSPEFNEFKASFISFDFDPSTQRTWEQGQTLDQEKIANDIVAFRAKKKLPALPSSPTASAFVLSQFPLDEPVLAELRQAALSRPYSSLVRQSIPPLGLLFEMDIPSFQPQRKLTQSLQIQACAALVTGDKDTAFASTLAALQLANGLGDQPYTIVEAMIAVVIQRRAIQPLWEGLHQHAWSDEQLAHFTRVLSRSHLFEGLAQSLRNERNNTMFLQLASLKDKQFKPYPLLPGGWWRQNQVTYAGMHAPILLAIDSHSTPAFLDRLRPSKLTPPSTVSPYQFLAWAFLPSYEKVTTNTARSDNATRLALTACALERHYLAHGAYPESLTALVPAYLPAVPLDIIDGAPLRYRRDPDATFTLYSLALDGDDDNGHRAPSGSNDLTTDGDWAW